MSAQAKHLEFAPPPDAGTGRALAAALFVHGLLLVALTAGIQWQKDDPLSAEAELWSAVPMAAAPPLAAVEPPPPPEPSPQPKPEPAPKPVVVKPPPPEDNREAEIALAKRRKQLDDEKKLLEAKEAEKRKQLERQKEEDKKAELKKAQEKKDKLKAEEEKRKLDAKRDDERKEKERKEAKKQQEQKEAQKATKQAAEDAKKLDAIRDENMRRIAGMAGATGSENSTGTALRASGPSDSYGGRIRARIKPNITFTEDIASNTPAEVEVRCAPDGTIVGRKLVKSSGSTAWDNAVLKAIDKTEVLPRDTDGRVHSPLIISFRPRD
jgi:colicin import membrane protein